MPNVRHHSEGDAGIEIALHEDSDRNSPTSGGRKKRVSYISGASPMGSTRESLTVGETGTFQSAAVARRMLKNHRRHMIRESLREEESLINETTALKFEEMIQGEGSHQQPKYLIAATLKEIILGKFVSVLLILAPFAAWAHYMNWGATYIFWLNFLVMIPLASILGDFTEEVALHTNQTVGGLVNATFGNAVEVVVAIQALLANEIRVVQASMIGSIFSNLLLVLGCCFFFGGLKYKEQSYNGTAATANLGLLSLSSIALVLPTPFAEYYNVQDEHVLIISRFAAVFLLFMYIQLLVFQLHTHAEIFDGEAGNDENEDESKDDKSEEEEEEATIPMNVALIGLLLTTLTITIFSDFLVESIDEFCEESGVSRTFVGLIILPIVGNAVEHITAVTVAMKNKMDLSMGVAVGSCTQISLFVVPLTVLVGWACDKPMTLNFPHFEIILYILSVFTVSICLSNGKGNWLEGSLLITTYVMIAIGFWFEKVIDFR